MLRRLRSLLFALLVVLVLTAGCGTAQQAGTTDASVQENKEFAIVMTPSPAISLKENKLVLTLTDEQRQAWGQATVSVKLGMEGMDHGEEAVSAVAVGDGRYEATVIPTMPGAWTAHVTIAGQAGEARVDFSFAVQQ